MKSKIMITISAAIVTVIAFSIIEFKKDSPNKYESFEQLEKTETINEDYSIHFEENDPDVLLMAIHGGGLEAGTTELTEYIASANGYSYYTFNGIKQKSNLEVRIQSTKFDEPMALEAVFNSFITLSFHGYEGEDKNTYVGGLDEGLSEKVKLELINAGFSVSNPPKTLAGEEKDNIVNKNKNKKGVQIEISTAQREAFFENNSLSSENRKSENTAFYEYANAIAKALND